MSVFKDFSAGSKLSSFKEIVEKSIFLLNRVDNMVFRSPYSVIPLIQQFIGLNTPLMGSGDSPYSLMSISFYIEKERKTFEELYNLPLTEKRLVVDELYEMIAPILLEEEREYIQFLADTKYSSIIKTELDKKRFFNLFSEKIEIAREVVVKFTTKEGSFAHIVHYGYSEDLYREYDFLEDVSEGKEDLWHENSFPVVNEMIIRGFPSEDGFSEKELCGWVIFVANPTEKLLKSSKLRKRKILQAARLAEKLGAKIVGMGGLIASFAGGGEFLSANIKKAGFTTGHAYTIANIVSVVEQSTQKLGISLSGLSVSVVGAAGSIGSGVAKLLSARHLEKMTLVDLNTFNAKHKLEKIKKYISEEYNYDKVVLSTCIKDIKKSDIVIVATNSPVSLVKSEFLKEGVIVIDDSFPKNVSKEVLDEREDVLLLEGGMTRMPLSVEILTARNMPDLMDLPLTRAMTVKELYSCFAETLVLALCKHKTNYGLGISDPVLAEDIMQKAERCGFSSAPLQCFDEAIQPDKVKSIREKFMVKQETN